MPPLAIAAAVVAGGAIASGIASKNASAGALGDANNNRVMANNMIQELQNAPDISKPLILEKYKQAGLLTPQMEADIKASMPQTISVDPSLRNAQQQALKTMQERSAGGLTAADRAGLNQARMAAQGDVKGRLASIQQQAAMRGQSGGGAELAAQLMAAQGGANTEAEAADRLAAQAQNAALQSTQQAGSQAGSMEGQQFGEAANQRDAQQQMERFNVGNQIAQQQRNVSSANQAQAGNLANLQNINNANVTNQNQEDRDQLNRQMQQWQNNVKLAGIKSDSMLGRATQQQAEGERAGQAAYNSISGPANAVGSMIGGGFGQKPAAAGGTSNSAYSSGGSVQDYRDGGKVPGQAQVAGDSPRNDTVHAKLSPQEIVVPRTLSQSPFGKTLLKLIKAHNEVKNHLNSED